MRFLGILLFASLLNATKLLGQTSNKEFLEAEDLMTNNRFAEALPHYQNLLKLDSSNATLNFKIGVCYINSRSQKEKAVYFLNKAIAPTTTYYTEGTKKQTDNPIIAYKFLGTCHLSYNFEQVNEIYEKFKKIILDSKNKTLSTNEVVDLKMELNKIGEELKAFNSSAINLKIENTDKTHHTSFVEYSSTLSSDQSMTFTFQNPVGKDGKPGEERFFLEDIDIPAAQTSQGRAIGKGDSLSKDIITPAYNVTDSIDTINRNEATVATSEDNQAILSYKDDTGSGNLYISRLSGNQWTAPEKLDKTINTKGWETNECASADGNTLYFTSDRKGGFGGMDIYRTKKMLNGEWDKATNLGPVINTPYDDRAPYVHPDGTTLYFSSNGRKTIRNFDIFTSSLSDSGTWSEPVNIGYPANKIGDNVFHKVVYPGEKDIITFISQKKIPFTVLLGKMTDPYGKVPEHVGITITDNETGEVTGSYNSNWQTGQYLFVLPPGRNNNLTYKADNYLFNSENMDASNKNNCYETSKAVHMQGIAEGSKITLNNIFFDADKATLRSTSNIELTNLLHLLTTHPGLVVEISTGIISQENTNYNKIFGMERARAIEQYLIGKGIHKENITAKAYVKSKSTALNETKRESTDPLCKQLNQSVELKIVETK